jgi:RNA polymerase sigma factor (sigma-70 family)
MPPPPAEPFASRVFLGPALRAQPDRRLVKLAREGYEAAFEEIVRRYRRPLDRFAAAIVGGRSEDVTQDAFSKALLALRGTTTEIELRPWLYRIVRNTALNDLRDGPPATEELGEAIPGGRSPAEEVEGREEIGELMQRLRALPEPQRAAIVMRELEGLSHEEIAAALGVSGGAARQAIYRGRMALRDGFGLLIPLPLLRVLFDHGAEAAGAGAGGVAATGAASAAAGAGGAGTALGGLGAGAALKVGVATAVLAGSIGAGVAMRHDRGGHAGPAPAEAATARPVGGRANAESISYRAPNRPGQAPLVDSRDSRGHGGSRSGDDHGGGHGTSGSSGHGGRGSGHGSHSGSGGDSEDHSGEEISGGSRSGRHGPGSSESGGSGSGGSGNDSDESSGEDSHSSGGGSGGSGGGGRGRGGSGSSDDHAAPAVSPSPAPASPPTETSDDSAESGPGGADSGSGGGSGNGGPGGGSDDS